MCGVFLLVCLLMAALQGWMGDLSAETVARLEQAGHLAIGWGTGVMGWLLTGHLATSFLLKKAPATRRLWQKDVLVNSLPIFKYVTAGILFLGLGIFLGYQLWGLFIQAFDIGFLVGAICGLLFSLRTVYYSGPDRIDLLEANHRYLNERKVPLFSNKWQ